ncbi:hypothetical protein [Chitinophaga eiseniae]|uniref:Uncharacterized protein n=1 Tax=Chitinophaga eiseniae TaxID=634771 RepID=A0A847SKX8_9BACT|nr:hypothetical protein [Chitinophaga eiseniae]NLR79447.1 hypothetical protein [Chitinophaga eiseniae]
MRILVTALLSAIVMLSISCKKDSKDDAQRRKYVSMKLDNRVYLVDNPKGTIYAPNLTDENPNNDYPRLEITGQTYTGDVITMAMAAPSLPFAPGAYPATKTGNGMSIVLNSVYANTLVSTGSSDFVIRITRIDNMVVEGTFSGTLADQSAAGGPRSVQDGAFRAIITQVGQ